MNTIAKKTLLLFCSALSINLMAQEEEMPDIPEERMQQIKAQKSAFITQRLDLTPEEAQKFWPVYNQYEKETEANRKEMRAGHKALKGSETLSEAEASAALDKELAARQKELDIRRKYAGEFKKMLGAVKTLQLGRAERDFHRELIKRVRQHNEGGRERHGERREGQQGRERP